MESFFSNLISKKERASSDPDSIAYSASFVKNCKKMCATKLATEKRYEILLNLKPQLCVRSFTYTRQDQRDSVKKAMLDIWELTLHNCVLDIWNPNQIATAYTILRSLIQRSEFNLEFLDGMKPSLTDLSSLVPLQIALSRRYFALLVETFQYVAKKMIGLKELQREPMHLHAEVLAISFIRIPSVQERIIKCAVTHKFLPVVDITSIDMSSIKSEPGENGGEMEYDIPTTHPPSNSKTSQVPPNLKPTDRKHYHYYPSPGSQAAAAKFIEAHPSLFKWNLFESEYIGDGDPESLIPEDTDWTKLILCNAEFFCVFFGYLCKHIFDQTKEKYSTNWDAITGYHDLVDIWCVALELCCSQTMDIFMRMEGVFPSKKQKLLNHIKDITSEMLLERAARARRSVIDCTLVVIKGHPSLINHTMLILFRSTNVYYMKAVDHALDQIQQWFASVSPSSNKSDEGRLEYKPVTAADLDGGSSEVVSSKAAIANFMYKENDEIGVQRVPKDFDMDLYVEGLRGCLEQEGFQLLMKILSFIYNNIQYLHGEMRMKLMYEVLIKEYFFRFFLHWSDEVRGFFHRILVFKAFRTSRRFLPCQTDTLLMSTTMFDRTPEEQKIVSLTARARSAQTSKKDKKAGGMLDSISEIIIENEEKNALSDLTGTKDKTSRPSSPRGASSGFSSPSKEEREQRMSSLDHKFLDHEQTTLDLVLVSKLDAYIRLVMEQVADPTQKNFDSFLLPYAQRSLREYTAVLRQYYDTVNPTRRQAHLTESHKKLSIHDSKPIG